MYDTSKFQEEASFISQFGRNWRVTLSTHENHEPSVSFYDRLQRTDRRESVYGDIVGTYSVSTILCMPYRHRFALVDYVPTWTIDGRTMEDIKHWLITVLASLRNAEMQEAGIEVYADERIIQY